MKKKLKAAIVAVITALSPALALAGPINSSPLLELPAGRNLARAGACAFPDGGWTIVNCSEVAAATSTQLHAWSRYVIQCNQDSYIAWGDTSSDAADANDGYTPEGGWLEFVTTDTVRYVSCLNVSVDGDCRYIECL